MIKRDKLIQIRVTHKERKLFLGHAKAKHVPLTTLIRQLIYSDISKATQENAA